MRFLVSLLAALPLAAAGIAIEDVTVIDVATGMVHAHMTVLIEQGKITRVGPASAPVPASVRVIDGKDKFLIPGLWDMEVHLYDQRMLPLFVAFGVTGVQDFGGDFAQVTSWRDQIEKNGAVGPHIVTSGPPVDGEASGDPKHPVLVARNPDEARLAFDRLYKLNVDFIAIEPSLPRDAYFALAEEARHWDLRVAGPIPANVRAREAVEARQKTIEHMTGIVKSVSTDDDALDFFRLCARDGTRVTPTLALWLRKSHMDDTGLMNDPRLQFVPAPIRGAWPDVSRDSTSWKAQVWRVYRLVALAKAAKTEILAGSGAGDPYVVPGASLADELEQMVEAGLTPRDALEAATLAPARFLESETEMGSVAKGQLADLVLLDASPLDDIRNVRKIAGVIAHGRYFARKDLDELLGLRGMDAITTK